MKKLRISPEARRWAHAFTLFLVLPTAMILSVKALNWLDDALHAAALIAHWNG